MHQTAVGRDLARVHAVVDDADAEEERARDEPCDTIWKIAPWMPCSVKENRPIVTKPMWATDE